MGDNGRRRFCNRAALWVLLPVLCAVAMLWIWSLPFEETWLPSPVCIPPECGGTLPAI